MFGTFKKMICQFNYSKTIPLYTKWPIKKDVCITFHRLTKLYIVWGVFEVNIIILRLQSSASAEEITWMYYTSRLSVAADPDPTLMPDTDGEFSRALSTAHMPLFS